MIKPYVHRYYCLQRPPAPGTIPRGVINIEYWDARPFVSEINHHAWGYVEYERKLTDAEISDYELAPAGIDKMTIE